MTHTEKYAQPAPGRLTMVLYLLVLLAFWLPATRININGHHFSTYPLTAYPGQVLFALLLLLALVQAFFFFSKKKILKWLGLVAGFLGTAFAIHQVAGVFSSFGQTNPPAVSTTPLPGVYLLVLSAGMLFAISLAKIVAGYRNKAPLH